MSPPGQSTIRPFLPASETDACEVAGRVRGRATEGATVRAVVTTLAAGTVSEEVVAEGSVDRNGSYRLRYARPSRATESADTTLRLRMYGRDGQLIGQSAPVLSPSSESRIDVRPTRAAPAVSEYALLEQEIAEGLSAGVGALDAAEEAALDEVSEWLDVESEHLRTFQRARALETETSLPAPMFYALGRSGLSTELEDLVDVPLHELRTTLDEAATRRLVDAESVAGSERLDQLAEAIVHHATRPDARPSRAGLVEALAAADLPPDTIQAVVRKFQSRTGTADDFWDSFSNSDGIAEEIGDDTAREVQIAVRMAEVLGPDPALLRKMHDLRRAGVWQAPPDLARYTFDDWCDLIEEAEGGAALESETAGDAEVESANEMIEERAGIILDALEAEYPNAFLHQKFSASDDLSPAARQLLERAPDHDFHQSSMRQRIADEPGIAEGFEPADAEQAIGEIERIERMSRVADCADETALLVSTGLESAMEVASIPKRVFAELYGEALGGRPQAARVHAQAQQVAAGAKLAALQIVQSTQSVPRVLGAPAPPEIKGVPDARTLFQASAGFCDCEHCGSVFSPAAYFVDLLRYLTTSSPDRLAQLKKKLEGRTVPAAVEIVNAKLAKRQPIDVLLGRRPDLADLPLTCENTLTALPYIDLVNELLEAAITGGSAAFDTGKIPTEVLQAVPQNLSREAYQRLQQAIHPLTLPYHQPLALARAYLHHLGVTRLELLRVLGRGDLLNVALTAEAMGMSPEQFEIVALPPTELWRHFGFAAEQSDGVTYVQALARVPVFLESTGMTFQNLIDLIDTRFLNADQQLSLDTPSPDCDPDKIQIAGLDEPRLSRMLQLIRLQRQLGWTFAVLDQTLRALGATDLTLPVLEKLTAVRELAKRLDRPVPELLVFWAPTDAWGKDNLFDRLFKTRAVAWRTQDERTFQLRADRLELAETGESVDAVASPLLAAFRITSEELGLIRALLKRRGAEPRLDLAGLTAVYQVVVLSRALQLRIPALDLLLRLIPPEMDPFRAGDPAATLRFVDLVREVQASDFTPERLAYLFRHESDPRRDPGPLPAQVEAVLASIRRGLVDVFTETSQPAEVTGDTLRQKLGTLLDAALLDQALEVLDPRVMSQRPSRREFFDWHLAAIFPDPAAAAARLLEPAPAGTSRDALELRWRVNLLFVLEHLLPKLRARQLRGSVIQTLGDTLGLSVRSTAKLLDEVLRSRYRSGQPLLQDFLAMLGTGLTGTYFANNELTGEPAVVRVDPEISFSWGGAPPADSIPATGFSARWTGYFLPQTRAVHTFYLGTDGAVRLSLKIDGADKILVDQPAPSGKVIEHASTPIALDPNRLVEITIEYRNQGAPATLSLQAGTGPAAKQSVPTTSLHPAGGLSTFAPIEQSYRRLHKAALIVTGFGITDAQLDWLTADPPYLNLDALPMEPGVTTEAAVLFHRWRQLAALYALRRKLPRSNVDLFEVFVATTLSEAIDRLVLATGWDRGVVEAFIGPDGLAIASPTGLRPVAGAAEDPAVLRLARAVEVQRRVGVAPATLFAWANAIPDADTAAAIVQAVKARYDEKRWLEVARSLNDPLRSERRDALVTYLLPRLRHLGIQNRNQLFEYFLIDVEMNPCMLTSRIRQATGAVQTFFQRALMNLEPDVPPRVIDDNDWKFLKNYRVFEAAKKVFLFPENWIEPDLRDDKSPLFQVLERTILQQEIKNDNVEAAFADYLEGLDEVARLDVRGVWFERRPGPRIVPRSKPSELKIPDAPRSEWDHGTYHVFARTFNAPHVWFYRRLEDGRTWTAWEKIDVDIEGDHLLPVVFHRRMHLFWTMFREVSKPVPQLDRKTEGPAPSVGKDWEIELAYSVYDRGKWSRKRLSTGGVVDVRVFTTIEFKDRIPYPQTDGSSRLSPADYTLRAEVVNVDDLPPQLHLHLYCRTVDRIRRESFTLSDSQLDHIARFELNGCNGALVPDRDRHVGVPVFQGASVAAVGRRKVHAAMGGVRHRGNGRPFQIGAGGVVSTPAGYQISGMRFSGSRRSRGALLAMSSGDARGVSVALTTTRTPRHDVSVVPIADPEQREPSGLFPFFFQDRFRSYFVRPIHAKWHPARPVAVPIFAQPVRLPVVRPKPRPAPRPGPFNWFGGRGRREEIDEAIDVAFEARDAWEDEQDDAWHPDDAAEARPKRQRERPRQSPPAARPRAAPAAQGRSVARATPRAVAVRRVGIRVQQAFHEYRLQFAPFEHADTCRLLSTLKAKGLEGLLDFSTTRPQSGKDHVLQPNGKWALSGSTWFQRHYGAGPLLWDRDLPHLDVAFEVDHPYALYNWELFFHAPLQVAVRLAKDGRHEEAQRWFHFIFDPTTDSSSPSPQRYWRFAPFYENNEYDSARDLMHLLSYTKDDAELLKRKNQVLTQLSAWWEKPFSPHVIARLRIAAYQKAVVMKYIDNLVEWGDKLFRRDTMESIQEATQIYILAANILGPRPEKIPPIVSKPPLTFRQMRETLNVFSNVEVRLENLQVRRPFRISARPDTGATTLALGAATQYFCTPANPQLDKYWDTVADRLHKIRNCMNIQGIVRQLALFDPPIDPGLLVRAAAAGVDLGTVIASLNAPPPQYRFGYLLARATRLAEEIRTFGVMTVRVLERRDAEGLASLRASNETSLLQAIRDIRKKQVRQVEEELAEFSLQKEHVEVQIQHLNTQLQQLMNPQEEAQQKSMTAAQVVSGVAEGVDLVAKVMHAIPDFQTGAAGAFSSPFVTLQLGGQMFGDIVSAFSASFEKIVSKHEAEADLAAAQAEYQRRREEWQHEVELLAKEKAQIEKRIIETQLKLEITSAELRRHDLEVENSTKVGVYLREKYTNEQLYGWMLGQLSGVYFQAYKVAFDAAQQTERAFKFERGSSSTSFIEFSYWDSLKKGLLAGERLLVDLRRLEAAYVEDNRRGLEVTRHLSLRDDYPAAFVELIETGRCQIEVSEALLDGDFPGHYFRRLKTVSLTMAGPLPPHRNVNCTLTLLENRIRTDANASGSYAPSADADDSRFLVNVAPIQAVATSKPDADPGVFHLRFDDDRFLPFEGAGAISTWRLTLNQADNAVDLSQLNDVVIHLSYSARTGGAALESAARSDREKALARGGLKPEPLHLFSLKRDAPVAWKQLADAAPGQDTEVVLPFDPGRFSGRYRGLDVRIERMTVIARARAPLGADALRVRLDPPRGSGTSASGWSTPWPRSRAARAVAEVSGPVGNWKLAAAGSTAKISELLDDLLLIVELRAKMS